MSNSLPEPTPLHVLNLHSRGLTMKEAWAVFNGKPESEPVEAKESDEPVKLSAKEKKAAIRKELLELGADLPAHNASAAKWSEALTFAREYAAEDSSGI